MDDSEFDADAPPSKTQLKKEMHELQALGEALVELSQERLQKVPLPDALREAVVEAQRISKRGARRRQLQYIGRLMRNIEAEPIREALDALSGNSREEAARQHRAERLRSELLDDEGVLHRIAESWPAADLQHLRVLRRNALKEQEKGKPPRAFRELYRELKELDESGGTHEWAE